MSSPLSRLFRAGLVLLPVLATAPFVVGLLADALAPVPGRISRGRNYREILNGVPQPWVLPLVLAGVALLAMMLTGVGCAFRELRTDLPARGAGAIGVSAVLAGMVAGIHEPSWVLLRAFLGLALASFVVAGGFALLFRSPAADREGA